MMASLQTILLLLSCIYMETLQLCPVSRPCWCERDKRNRFIVKCVKLNLRVIPRFSGHVHVDVLDLGNNQIQTIKKGDFVNIRPISINLNDNDITDIDDDAFIGVKHYLKKLSIEYNRGHLKYIPTKALSVLTNLEQLHISVHGMKTIPASAFPPLPKLTVLGYRGEDTEFVHGEAFRNIKYTLLRLSLGLKYGTRFHSNEFPGAVRNLKRLESLYLAKNKITHIPSNAFIGMAKLRDLDLNGNDLSGRHSLRFDSFRDVENTLETLNIRSTNVMAVPTHALRRLRALKSLNIGCNNIWKLASGDLSYLDSLEELILGKECSPLYFNESSFSGVEDTLKILSLWGMKLYNIPLNKLKTLRVLDELIMEKNNIITIPAGATEGLKVRLYDFSSNKITRISPAAFRVTKIRDERITLKLSNNGITEVNFLSDPCSFKQVTLDGNPLVCDCALFNISIPGGIDISGKCATPLQYARWDISTANSQTNFEHLCPDLAHKKRKALCPLMLPPSTALKDDACVNIIPAGLLIFCLLYNIINE